jgi:hypothetical protein
VLEGCKWDPQVGDLDTLSPFPLVMKSSVWKRLASYAELLTAEAILAEEEISQRPELLEYLLISPWDSIHFSRLADALVIMSLSWQRSTVGP